MKYNISDCKLKAIVDELGEEYKELLIERVLSDMQEVDADLINASDLMRLDVATKSSLRVDKKVKQKKQIISIITFFTFTYFLLISLLVMTSDIVGRRQLDVLDMMSLAMMFVAVFVTLYSSLIENGIKTRSRNYMKHGYTISPYEIVNKWKEMEALINELTPDGENLSLFSMLKVLKEIKVISDQDIEGINKLLDVRSKMIHADENEIEMSQSELRGLLIQADDIIVKMKKIE